MEEILTLGNVVKISKGKKHNSVVESPNGKTKRYIQIEDLRNDFNLKFTDEQGVEVNGNDVIIAWDGANAGTIGFNLQGFIGSTLARLRIEDSKVDSKYLGWLLRGKFKYLRSQCTGATIPHISKAVLENIPIPIYSIKTQQKIASILEQADTARQKRKQANQLTEQFLQAFLFEFIGNNPIKENKFPLSKLEDVCFEIADIDHNMPKAVEKGMPFISAKDLVDDGRISFEDTKFISVEDFKRLSRKIKPQRGDILYSRIGAKLGKARIVKVDFDFIASYSCCTIRPNTSLVNTIYLNAYLDSEFNLRQAKLDTKGIGVPDLGMDKIRNFLIPLPPLPLQQKFASLVERVEKLREKQKESERGLENLFQSLMQKYFGN